MSVINDDPNGAVATTTSSSSSFSWSTIPRIELSVPLPPSSPSSEEHSWLLPPPERRYYKRYFTREEEEAKEEDDGASVSGARLFPQAVLLHSNRICLVALSPRHPVVRERRAVRRVNFQVTKTLNRLDNAVRGKGKRGGQSVDERATLCLVECEDGRVFPVRSNVRGKLIEVNDRLVREPNLLRDRPLADGFVAIVLLKIPEGIDDLRKRMVAEEEEDAVGTTEKEEAS